MFVVFGTRAITMRYSDCKSTNWNNNKKKTELIFTDKSRWLKSKPVPFIIGNQGQNKNITQHRGGDNTQNIDTILLNNIKNKQ